MTPTGGYHLSSQNTLAIYPNFTFCFSAKIAKRINQQNIKAYIFFEQNIAKFFTVTNDVTICKDKNDNFLLYLAKDANAEFLITRDADLLVLNMFGNTEILTLKKFIEVYKKFKQ